MFKFNYFTNKWSVKISLIYLVVKNIFIVAFDRFTLNKLQLYTFAMWWWHIAKFLAYMDVAICEENSKCMIHQYIFVCEWLELLNTISKLMMHLLLWILTWCILNWFHEFYKNIHFCTSQPTHIPMLNPTLTQSLLSYPPNLDLNEIPSLLQAEKSPLYILSHCL